MNSNKSCLFLIAALFLLHFSNAQPAGSSGVKKDIGTGLTCAYKNIVPGRVMLVMNEEIINHTDIPIGEKFTIINDKIKGLVEKKGKVSIGCSLLVVDKNGKKIMNEPDLFAENGIYNTKDVTYLRCGVSTGKPMKWEEKYFVTVTFWDKYGQGKLVNKVTIRIIDIP